jgi:hypothetical protein
LGNEIATDQSTYHHLYLLHTSKYKAIWKMIASTVGHF